MMKFVVVIVLCLCTGFAAFAQDLAPAQVPVPVMNTFNTKFAKALTPKWKRAGLFYDVNFVLGVADHYAELDSVGTLMKHEYDISSRSLPKPVQDAIIKNYPQFKIEDVQRIDVGRTTSTFVVQVKYDSQKYKVTFDQEGKELSKK